MPSPAWRKCALLLFSVGTLLLVASLLLLVFYSKIHEMVLHQNMLLINGTTVFNYWQATPFPIFLQVYFFNITNPRDFLNSGAKLRVAEVGPYTYRSKWVKNILGWHQNGTVSYQEIRTYHFVPEKSNGTENDLIVSFNGPMIATAKELQSAALSGRKAASRWLRSHNEDIIIEKTVGELTYCGYKDPIVKYAPYVKPDSPFKDGKFAWLYGMNGSNEGSLTVFTGQQDLNKLNVIDNWNGKRNLGIWNGEKCNMIKGTTGELSPPLKHGQESYTFFMPTFCRSLTFYLSAQVKVRGLLSHKFVATKSTLRKSINDENSSCFGTDKDLPSGVQDIGPCKSGVPVVVSFPHFYLADPSFVEAIDGLNPQAKKHLSYISVEPNTGLSVATAMRFQINLLVERVNGVQQFETTPEGVFPVYWTEINVALPEEISSLLQRGISGAKFAFHFILGVFIFVSVMMICVGAGILKRCHRFSKKVTIISRHVGVPLLGDCVKKVPVDKHDCTDMLNDVELRSKSPDFQKLS